MTYTETLDWLWAHLPMYQEKGRAAFRGKLDNILLLCDHLGNPQEKFPTIHIAGTNGKGSSSHAIASVLQEAGYKVGLYTSPHLKDFRERIKINGENIPQEAVTRFVKDNKDFMEGENLSFFEVTVGMAFDYFSQQKVDIAVIEVGLGGRLDSTNIITPIVSLITNIGKDHTEILGNTLPEIAKEKAGIIKPYIPVVISEYHKETAPVFEQIAKERKAPIYFANTLETSYTMDLKGDYQSKNIKGILQTLRILQEKGWHITEENIQQGLTHIVRNTHLMGRWQVLGDTPKVVCDTAHNADGFTEIFSQLEKEKYATLHMVIGFVKEKDLEAILPLFPKNAVYYFCMPKIDRGLNADILQKKAKTYNLIGEAFSTVRAAFEQACKEAAKEDFIYVGGSTFVVAEIV
ncbi:folylpolyglutamate synthase/dihydrofolate synthase family protein [Capnocytophaga sp. G2]|uniref:bifunctional folylpolyglutamate synthase/dihydrofolate synthase n=1 Tax=Capnocytophaga sp. G2 TaxID=3110695 RepID=UPI002B46E85C|nr:folylpolyglutamate synthase/dihydrofolate synthase family protein [Capnocytophaga sp. G2]MEB3004080.1 folylpolyglutamate synthase/dihydrofolate synthase family protein [Capnocytophaga sp. G2]